MKTNDLVTNIAMVALIIGLLSACYGTYKVGQELREIKTSAIECMALERTYMMLKQRLIENGGTLEGLE